MEVRFLSYEELKKAAQDLWANSKFRNRFPVPIEQIVEDEYRIEIIPIIGLERAFSMPAFISKDLKTISVDDRVLEGALCRYRFTLAHELGHRILHAYLLSDLEFDTIGQWKTCLNAIPEKQYSFMEYQANTFANALLVPQDQLEIRFEAAVSRIRAQGLDTKKHSDVCLDSISFDLGKQFEVSKQTMQIRLGLERLGARL